MYLQIRPSDCDSMGHVNNAIYLAFLEQTIASQLASLGYVEDWQKEGEHHWRPLQLVAEYRQPSFLGDNLWAKLWHTEVDETQLGFGFEVERRMSQSAENTGESIFRSRSTWMRIRRDDGVATALPKVIQEGFQTEAGKLPRLFELPADCPDCLTYTWETDVHRTNLDPSGEAHLPAIYNWLEDAIFDASAQGGWPLSRWLKTGYFTLQTRHDTQFFHFPGRNDHVRLSSRLIDVKRLRGTWLIEAYRREDEVLLFRDYSTGVFLNLEGRPASPPHTICDELQHGQ